MAERWDGSGRRIPSRLAFGEGAGSDFPPQGEDSAVIHSQSCTYKFTIDKCSDPWYGCGCYLEETSHTPRIAPALTLDLSISCSLLALFLQLLSVVFNSLRPLFPKHPGWGYPVVAAVAPK